jgi:FkbM family methyltransferase
MEKISIWFCFSKLGRLIILSVILTVLVLMSLTHFFPDVKDNIFKPKSWATPYSSSSRLITSQESLKTCDGLRSEVVEEARPFCIFIHPIGKDIIVSDSIAGKGKNTEMMFESHIRATMLNATSGGNKLIFDIGANIGLHSLFLTSAGHTVHAFESLAANRDILECSIVQSGFEQRIVLNKFALSDETGSTCMSVEDKNMGHSMISASLDSASCPADKTIFTKRFDEYLSNALPVRTVPFLIKIDTEGHEFKALNPAKRILSKVRCSASHLCRVCSAISA